ncbi:unnamed protein product [Amoebophrya sp. A25]|nr:unnamed protein product [Amoebophrya sp. A25]|eukprot:GSA25T00014477001.1
MFQKTDIVRTSCRYRPHMMDLFIFSCMLNVFGRR